MEKEQAWNILAQAIVQLKATLQEHQVLQQALNELKPKEETKSSD